MASPPEPALAVRPWVASYPPGVPPTYRLPPVRLSRLLDDAARDFPEHPAIEFRGAQLSYTQLQERVDELARALQTLDAPEHPLPGAHVIVVLPDGFAGPVLLFGLWRVGAIPVPLGPDVTARQVERIVQQVDAVGILADERLLRRLAHLPTRFTVALPGDAWEPPRGPRLLRRLPSLPRPRRRRGGGAEAETERGRDAAVQLNLDELLARGTSGEPLPPLTAEPGAVGLVVVRVAEPASAASAEPDDLAADPGAAELAFTVHTHRSLLATAFQSRLWLPDVQAGRERTLVAEPLHDLIGSAAGLLPAVLSGATSILLDHDDGPLGRAIERTGPTLLVGRAQRIATLHHEAEDRRRDLSSLRVCFAVGDGLLPHEASELERRAVGARVRHLHGWGDAMPIAHGQPVYGRVQPTAIGLPVTSTVAAVVDPQDLDRPCDADAVGRLVLHGPQLAERTDDGAIEDGWLVTGLLARVDADGWFTVVGTDAEVVEVGGRPRAPARIAAALRAHPTVRDVEVAEVDDRLVAAVVGGRRRVPRPDILAEALALTLDAAARPDDIVIVDELPKVTASEHDPERLRERIREAWEAATVHTDDDGEDPPDGDPADPDPSDARRPAP